MATGIDFGKQYGPLPLGAWVIVVAGGLGIAYYTRRAGTGPVVVEDTSGDPGVGEGPGWVAVPPPTTGPVVPDARPQTNDEWGFQAINWLIAQGYPPVMADSAIRKYLEAKALSPQEQALLQAALRHLGAPPTPLSGDVPAPPVVTPPVIIKPPVVSPPVVKPPAPLPQPLKLRYVIITPWPTQLSTLSGIARRYYGNAGRWPEIFRVNRVGFTRPDGTKGWIVNPDLIYPGRTVYVP